MEQFIQYITKFWYVLWITNMFFQEDVFYRERFFALCQHWRKILQTCFYFASSDQKFLSRSDLYQNTIVKKHQLEVLNYSYSSKFAGSDFTLLKCAMKFLAVTGVSLNNFESLLSKFNVTISTEIT